MRRRIAFPLLLATLGPGPAMAEETLFMRLESSLTALGYDAAPIDGLPDEGLSAAIARYKADRGLDPATPLSLQEFERLEEEVVASRTGSSDAPGQTPGSSEVAATPTAPPPGSAMGPGPTPAAPGLAAGGATGDCAFSPQDFLTGIEGNWTLTQHAGFAMAGGGIGTPLPAHPPQPMRITLDEDSGGIPILSAQGQSMILVPAFAEATAAYIDSLLMEMGVSNIDPISDGCDWDGMPSLVGTNTYVLRGDGQRAIDLAEITSGGFENAEDPEGENDPVPVYSLVFCSGGASEDRLREMIAPWGQTGESGQLGITQGYINNSLVRIIIDGSEECRPADSGRGDMDMTIFLRFTSPNSATGILSFRGAMQYGGGAGQVANFAAQASITMSR